MKKIEFLSKNHKILRFSIFLFFLIFFIFCFTYKNLKAMEKNLVGFINFQLVKNVNDLKIEDVLNEIIAENKKKAQEDLSIIEKKLTNKELNQEQYKKAKRLILNRSDSLKNLAQQIKKNNYPKILYKQYQREIYDKFDGLIDYYKKNKQNIMSKHQKEMMEKKVFEILEQEKEIKNDRFVKNKLLELHKKNAINDLEFKERIDLHIKKLQDYDKNLVLLKTGVISQKKYKDEMQYLNRKYLSDDAWLSCYFKELKKFQESQVIDDLKIQKAYEDKKIDLETYNKLKNYLVNRDFLVKGLLNKLKNGEIKNEFEYRGQILKINKEILKRMKKV